MRSIRWLTTVLTLSALASLPTMARAQGERLELMSKEKVGKSALSVAADLKLGGQAQLQRNGHRV